MCHLSGESGSSNRDPTHLIQQAAALTRSTYCERAQHVERGEGVAGEPLAVDAAHRVQARVEHAIRTGKDVGLGLSAINPGERSGLAAEAR